MATIKLPTDFNVNNKSHVANLHLALTALKLDISKEEKSEKKIEATTKDAIKKIQKEFKLKVSGKLDEKTLSAVNTQLYDQFITTNKYRTENLHLLMDKLKIEISKDEKEKRISGESTRKAIETFQKNTGLKIDGKLSEEVLNKLNEQVLKNRLLVKTQRGKIQSLIQKVSKVSKLDIDIDAAEIKNKEFDATTVKLIKAFQKKYKLPVTGELNKITVDKMTSVAASKGRYIKKLKTPSVDKLKTVNKTLRLNMVSPQVAEMQRNLSFLGYKISENENKTQTFGKTTIKAIISLQKEKGLAITGHYDKPTSLLVNQLIKEANPKADSEHRYRIRGSVRNQFWQRKNQMVIKIYEKVLDQESAQPLAAVKVHLNGFFDIAYDAPINPFSGRVKDSFHLSIKLFTVKDQDKPVAVQKHYNVNRIHWVNFIESKNEDGTFNYNGKYLGESEFEIKRQILQKAIGQKQISDLKETQEDKQISQLSIQTGLSTDDIMRQVLSQLVFKSVNIPKSLTVEVFYSFIAQNLLPDLPSDLLRGTSNWGTILQLTERAANGVALLDNSIQQQALDNAISQNLVSQNIKLNRETILTSLSHLRTNFILTKPILVGNGNLQSLLDESAIENANYPSVAKIFIDSKGINTAFWTELKTLEPQLGAEAIADFASTVEIANYSRNHLPTIQFIKNNTGKAAGKKFKIPSDVAKLDQADIVVLINANGKQVPDNTPGGTSDEKVANYAAAIKSRSELLYPAVSLVATAKRVNPVAIENVAAVEQFIDERKDLNFREQNLDKYIKENNINLEPATKASIKLVQRINKLTTNSIAGAALIDKKMHSSMQIYFTGKEAVKKALTESGVEKRHIERVYEAAKTQYMAVLARITDFRKEIYRDTPAAIIPHIYTPSEINEVLHDIPDLETLFGSLDFCECDHCKSLYGPAAYLTDMLRFLKEHLAIDATKTVKDILFERRPDLGNIKLNCDNTNVALPYIDLVCEILENFLISNKSFIYQTTLSQKELRATPENIQQDAYKIIASADFPMNNSFNLWQEEARTYLNYLRVPRFELMEAFQNKTNPAAKVPDDISIAAEFFGMSWKEKDLIITTRNTSVDQDKYWKYDTNQNTISVSLFKDRTGLTYYEILELLMVKFVNPDLNKSKITRTIDSCDVDLQIINNLNLSKFDLMHRFIRLWRKTGYKMWELDLLLRNDKIGKNKIEGETLINLKLFKQLQDRLKLTTEALLVFYGNMNREIRIKPEKQDVVIQPIYNVLFQNISVTNPVDCKFKGIGNLNNKNQPIDTSLPFELLDLQRQDNINPDPSIILEENPSGYNPVPTILSALALNRTDFDLLVSKTNKFLTIDSLSVLYRYVYLARTLKLSVHDLLLLMDVTNVDDPFSDLQITYDLTEKLEKIKSSGLSVLNLDYILNFKPDSSVGLRNESIAQLLEALRKILQNSRTRINLLNSLISFNADALTPLNAEDTIFSFSSFQGILISSKIDFTCEEVSADEIKFISEFSKLLLVRADGSANPDAAANKTALIADIKKIQARASLLLADSVTQKKNQIISHIATSFSISTEQSAVLLNKLLLAFGAPPVNKTLLTRLEEDDLIAKDNNGDYTEITKGNFGDHFKMYLLLHKSALLVSKMKIKTEDLSYFIDYKAVFKTIDFSLLPLTIAVTPNPNQFTKWLNLFYFLYFKSKFPEPEDVSIRSILDLAKDATKTNQKIKQEISALTHWDDKDDTVASLTAIESGLGIRHTALNLDYTNAELYLRLIKCFDQLRLTGTDAATVLSWISIGSKFNPDNSINIDSNIEIDKITSQQTRQAVKSKYEQDDWLSKITPLHDDIREKKRKALVDYFIDNSLRNTNQKVIVNNEEIPNPEYWKDSNALYKFFLIDVEMSSCQLTSRIKQALSSVQLFVQRCFLNLENRYVVVTQDEKNNDTSPNAWSQWKWMKNYRIWEANRKIFFYPENWLEPELRDDKSPFFKELENELMQNEVTKENVENAFLSYLHKMDEVSHLEVCGLYHQIEDLNPDEVGYETNIVHVVGRTKAIPNIYYYRTYNMNYNTWSAWEKIDVDIAGDHVTPVVYNRKLYLFWLQFMEKPMKAKKVPAAKPTDGPTDAPEPMKVLEVQLGWTVKKTGGWSSKKISKQKLIHPWERPYHSYNIKPYYQSISNELYLDIYLSTSREFNNTKFYDPHKKYNPTGLKIEIVNNIGIPIPVPTINESLKNPTYLTKNRFNETYLPWHSSSFIFDGEIKDVEIKGLKGEYYLPEDAENPIDTSSYNYVHSSFGEPGTLINELEPIEFGPRLRLPGGMHFKNTHLTNNRINSVNNSNLRVLEDNTPVDLITGALSPFELVITQQDLQLDTMKTDHPLFYQDNQRAFFIKPEWEARMKNYGQIIVQSRKYRFLPFYHPYTMLFIREFNRDGIDGLLNRKIQVQPQN